MGGTTRELRSEDTRVSQGRILILLLIKDAIYECGGNCNQEEFY